MAVHFSKLSAIVRTSRGPNPGPGGQDSSPAPETLLGSDLTTKFGRPSHKLVDTTSMKSTLACSPSGYQTNALMFIVIEVEIR